MTQVLLLAGTAEARTLTHELADLPSIKPIASLAGVTEGPAPLAIETRTGGFGGADGLARWLSDQNIVALIDATHPYAARMQANAVMACEMTGIPRLRLLRPPWPNRSDWIKVADMQAASDACPASAKVLLTTGHKGLAPFAERSDLTVSVRTIEPVAGLPANLTPILRRPPYRADDERALFALLGITHLVTKNAGGTGTAKLDVADRMGITTIVLDRPVPPPGEIAETVDRAVAWLHRVVAF